MILNNNLKLINFHKLTYYGKNLAMTPKLLWYHIASYSTISISYYLISLCLAYFIYKRKDLPYKKIFFLFATFLAICATTHIVGLLILWYPIYEVKIFLKSVSSIVSLITLAVMIKIIPDALKIVSPRELAYLNEQLKTNIKERDNIQKELEIAYQIMEQKVEERTAELARTNEQLLAEIKERQKVEERFALAIQATADGIWDWDLKTNKIYASSRLKAMLGFEKHEIDDCSVIFNEYVHPNDLKQFYLELQEYINNEGHYEFKFLFRVFKKDKTCIWILTSVTAVKNNDGKVCRLVGAFTDMTETKRMEEDLIEARNRAETYSRAKSDFLINMSHEIRTPMNAIIGLSNILMSSSPLTDKQMRYIFTLHNSAQALLDLINDLLDISKIENNKVTLEHISFNLEDLLNNVYEMIQIKAREKGLKLIVNYDQNISKLYYGDPARIRQIIVNLIENAIKFTDQGGVTVNITQLGSCDKNEKTVIKIIVADTGIGIKNEYMDSIFDKFMQADSSSSKKYVGMGLGLAICRGLVELMGGTVEIQSEFGSGSSFILHIPLMKTSFPCAENKFNMPIDTTNVMIENKHPTILLVEDYYPNVLFVEALLESFNYKMEIAYSGKEALEKFQKYNVSLILMDIQMQDMDGFEATRLIRELEEEAGTFTPIIAMTAHAVKGYEEKCLSSGMNDYISKPFNPIELKKKIDKCLIEMHQSA